MFNTVSIIATYLAMFGLQEVTWYLLFPKKESLEWVLFGIAVIALIAANLTDSAEYPYKWLLITACYSFVKLTRFVLTD